MMCALFIELYNFVIYKYLYMRHLFTTNNLLFSETFPLLPVNLVPASILLEFVGFSWLH